MVDMHSHVVFGVDDGVQTLEEAIEVLEDSYAQGVRKVVATPHYRKSLFRYDKEKITERFEQLKQAMKGRFQDLELFLGCEIYCSADYMDILRKKDFLTINNTSYVLMEFKEAERFREIKQYLREFQSHGYIPIVAHTERYMNLTAREVRNIVEMGCYIQVNAYCVSAPKLFFDSLKALKKRAREYLKQGLVHFISSDMHNMKERRSAMKTAQTELEKMLSKDYVQKLLYTNGSDMILGNEIWGR